MNTTAIDGASAVRPDTEALDFDTAAPDVASPRTAVPAGAPVPGEALQAAALEPSASRDVAPTDTARRAPDPQWTPIDPARAQQIIDETLARHDGDIYAADKELIGLREQPSGYYDSNLVLADDHLYARILTREVGPEMTRTMIGAYLTAKEAGVLPQTGPGPVSPYSPELRDAMLSGVSVEEAQMSPETQAYWQSVPGRLESLSNAASTVLRR
jgi:hypothetical protein